MSRRTNQVFNLSFLDLVTGALGAVIFLFIITPKGGSSAPDVSQAVVYVDTAEMKIFGTLHDSLSSKRVGDTLFAVLVDYKTWPKQEKRPIVERPPAPTPPAKVSQPKPSPPPVRTPEKKEPEKPKTTPKPPVVATSQGEKKTPKFVGTPPAVPCKVSFEVNWLSQDDNVDFFVCKGTDCVFGGKKRNRDIGQWDSGKSRNRLFGNDLRTTQEAVRQFDNIIPGEYRLFAQFKESKKGKKAVTIKGLIYTQDKARQQRGEVFTKVIPLSKNRVFIGRVFLKADGTYSFSTK